MHSIGKQYSFRSILRCHTPGQPLYFLVPPEVPEKLKKRRTFMSIVTINGVEIGRRSVKPWNEKWFVELTSKHLITANVVEGAQLRVKLSLAQAVPDELISALEANGLAAAWEQLTAAQRRALAEPICDAKRATTRSDRVNRVLNCLTNDK
ncbi:MAG: hypothetical protein DHS20C11_18340 [Lysobacteraceae bacterium]|nr:MAG: hypothetical protein DHS20C11_18340 [Xanthomonadaceae bacterium]